MRLLLVVDSPGDYATVEVRLTKVTDDGVEVLATGYAPRFSDPVFQLREAVIAIGRILNGGRDG